MYKYKKAVLIFWLLHIFYNNISIILIDFNGMSTCVILCLEVREFLSLHVHISSEYFFTLSTSNANNFQRSIWLVDRTLTDTTTPGRRNVIEGGDTSNSPLLQNWSLTSRSSLMLYTRTPFWETSFTTAVYCKPFQ